MTKSIVCDFAKISTMAEYRAAMEHHLSGLGDISLVVLNAGVIRPGMSHCLADETIEEVVRVNALHVCFASKIFLEILTKRTHRSAMIIVSSVTALASIPGMASYSSAKAFASSFGEALHYEVKDKVDVMVWTPSNVQTDIYANIVSGDKLENAKM